MSKEFFRQAIQEARQNHQFDPNSPIDSFREISKGIRKGKESDDEFFTSLFIDFLDALDELGISINEEKFLVKRMRKQQKQTRQRDFVFTRAMTRDAWAAKVRDEGRLKYDE